MRAFSLAIAAVGILAVCTAASAATITDIDGAVSLNTGKGFNKVASGSSAKPGDRVIAGPKSSARITYDGGCYEIVEPGKMARVRAEVVCQKSNLVIGNDPAPLLIGGLVVAGGVTAGILLSQSGSTSP